jgi:hypothetical protein
MNQTRYKFLEAKAKEKGKLLLIEEYYVLSDPSKITLYDKPKLVESNGKNFEARGVMYGVPLARYDEINANGRVYPKAIGQLMYDKKLVEGSDCLGDHAEDDGSVFDTVGVWHNFRMGENIGYADLYCIGEGGQLMLEKAKAGGKCGYSTVAFGSLMEDNSTVDPNTFELDENHTADWVRNPSAKVFGTFDHLTQVTESDKSATLLKESDTNRNIVKITEENSKELNMRNEGMDKIQEANLRNQIRVAIKEAKSKTSFKEGIEELKDVLTIVPEELADQKSKIEEAIVELTEKLNSQLSDAHKLVESKEASYTELKAKYDTLDSAMASLKEEHNRVISIMDKAGLKEDVDAVKLQESIALKEKEIATLKADMTAMKEDMDILLKEEVANRDKDIKIFIKERADMEADLKIYEATEAKLKADCAKLASSLKESNAKLAKLIKKMKEEGDDINGFDSILDTGDIELDFPVTDEDMSPEDIDWDDAEYDPQTDALSVEQDSSELDLVDGGIPGLSEAEEDDEKEDDEEEDDTKKVEEETEEEKKDDEKKDDEAEKKDDEKKEESKGKIKVKRKEVFEHYKKAVKKTPMLKDFARQILESDSLPQAIRVINRIQEQTSRKNEMVALKESGVKVHKIEPYTFKFGGNY